jgi:small subunit ribosomal protein S13
LEILTGLKINPNKKVKEISEEEEKMIVDVIKEMNLENDLRREINGFIKRLKEIKCYRGMRHNL